VERTPVPEQGRLAVVGLGPGDPAYLCERARDELHAAGTVIGYRAYCEQVTGFWPEAPVEPWPIGAEVERATEAVRRARAGERIAVVSSGDAGVYGMAGLVLDVLYDLGWDGERDPEVAIVPGITAALAAAARLGAPLGVDFAAISLSDLLVPWETIERRLRAAAEGDLALAIYNPRSAGRPDVLDHALQVLRAHCLSSTPAALVHDVCRPGERVELTTLGDLDPTAATMTTLVVVGCSTTRRRGRHLVTSRPYARRASP
jgi:cobalt-precorrin 5A hydrolase/precorrin-3B C17-methyltransferase